jgi:hypothetical protein
LCSRSMVLWASRPPEQSSARRRLPFQPPRWPSDTSKRIQSRSPSFRVHVQLRPPASLPNSAAAPAIGRGQSNAGSESFSHRCLIWGRRRLTNRSCRVIRRSGLTGGCITFERRAVAKMLMTLDTSWLIGLKSKALHGLFGQRSDDAIHLAATRARRLNGQMWCVG